MISLAQGWIFLILSGVSFVLCLISLIHAAVTKPHVFVAADKRTKTFWLLITGGATLLAFLSLPVGGPRMGSFLLTILPLVAAGIYLTDVRPALKEYGNRPRGGSGGWRSW